MSLALLGVWLTAVGAADLCRPAPDWSGSRRRVVRVVVGVAVLLAGLLVVELGWPARVALLVALAALLTAWQLAPARVAATLALGAGTLLAVLAAGAVHGDRAWPEWLAATVLGGLTTSTALVALGVVLVEVSTANLLVRLLLDGVGVPATSHEKQLRGGRVLGPMERVLLVALGALGELTATAIVVAAKGLLRFPELQRAQRASQQQDGPSDVTEYFLIGSLASWLVALAGAGLIHLSR